MKKLAVFTAFALLFALSTPASAATQAITYKLKASAAGQTAEFILNQTLDATAPATVAPLLSHARCARAERISAKFPSK